MDGACQTADPMSDSPESETPLEEAAVEQRPSDESSHQHSIEPIRVVEAILFASDSPLPASKVASILGVGDARDVKKHMAALNEQYESIGFSFRIEEIAGGFQMMTLPAYNTWLTKLLRAREETKLSPASLETLAIVAYKQPATRADIEAIRGVAAGDMLNRLRELNLVKIVGRAEDLGRPLLYGTTKHFLEVFGLGSLEDLPQVEVLKSPEASRGTVSANSGDSHAEAAAPHLDTSIEPESSERPALRIAEGA
ncbi:MAG: SMC-Scp complex subunit ScpB [Planctomycetota bacterium]